SGGFGGALGFCRSLQALAIGLGGERLALVLCLRIGQGLCLELGGAFGGAAGVSSGLIGGGGFPLGVGGALTCLHLIQQVVDAVGEGRQSSRRGLAAGTAGR